MTLFIKVEAKLEMDQFRFYFFGFCFWFGPELVFFFCVFGLNSFLEVTHSLFASREAATGTSDHDQTYI